MRSAVCVVMIFLVSCKEAGTYEKKMPIEPRWAGQYVLDDSEVDSRLHSLRYILSPDGTAERHLLKKSHRWADFNLESIHRGQWGTDAQAIRIRLKEGNQVVSETFDSLAVRIDPRDTTRVDTFWIDKAQPNRSLKRIASF